MDVARPNRALGSSVIADLSTPSFCLGLFGLLLLVPWWARQVLILGLCSLIISQNSVSQSWHQEVLPRVTSLRTTQLIATVDTCEQRSFALMCSKRSGSIKGHWCIIAG